MYSDAGVLVDWADDDAAVCANDGLSVGGPCVAEVPQANKPMTVKDNRIARIRGILNYPQPLGNNAPGGLIFPLLISLRWA